MTDTIEWRNALGDPLSSGLMQRMGYPGTWAEAWRMGLIPYDQDAEFPPHDPNFPDVNPATGDERETTGLDEHGDPLP